MQTRPDPATAGDQARGGPALSQDSSERAHPSSSHKRATLRNRVPAWLMDNSYPPSWMPERLRHPAVSYAIAVLGQLAAAGANIALLPVFPHLRFPGALGFLVTVLVALNYGPGPSILSAVLAAILAEYIALPMHLSASSVLGDVAGVLLYAGTGLCMSLLAGQAARARNASAERSQHLQSAFDAIGDGIVLYDTQGKWVATNRALRLIVGFDQMPGVRDLTIAERMVRFQTEGADGKPVTSFDMPAMRAIGGEEISAERAVDLHVRMLGGREVDLSVTASPLRNAAGRITGSVAVFRDITDRRRLERRQHASLESLLIMAEAMVSDGDDLLDSGPGPDAPDSGSSQTSSQPPAAELPAMVGRLAELTLHMLGCDRVTIIALDPDNLAMNLLAAAPSAPPAGGEIKVVDIFSLSDMEKLQAGEVSIITGPSETWRRRSLLVAPCLLHGVLVGLLTLDYQDDTHLFAPGEQTLAEAVARLVGLVIERERLLRERAEARASVLALREANQRMDEFLSIAAHELRTPLTTLKANAQIAAQRVRRIAARGRDLGFATDDDARDLEAMLARLATAVDRQERLVSDLLDVSRIRGGGLVLWPLVFDLGALLREITTTYQLAFPGRTLRVSQPEESVLVMADRERIGQVIANFMTNALKYSPAESPIEVELEQPGESARIRVRDWGTGLSPEQQINIWDRFHRVPDISPLSGSHVGLGLGLYISRQIIDLHHGAAGVESSPDHGSVFWFTLPMVGGESATPAP